MSAIPTNLQAVRQRILEAAHNVGRDPETIQLLAVSKTCPDDAVRDAANAGQISFGENYAQEAQKKILALKNLNLEWHFIGPLQSNKTRLVAEHFDWVHSIDRLRIAERLSAQRPEGLAPLQVCLEVNVSGENSKSGCAPQEVLTLCQTISTLPNLKLRGLMTIPAPEEHYEQQRLAFRRLHCLYETCRSAGLPLDTLSMGMSHDLEAAIAEGATIVRVGTAIFGTRPSPIPD